MPEVPVRAVVFDPPPVEATAETNPSFRPVANAVLLMLLIVALIRIRGAPERKTAKVRDPFVDTSRRDFEAE